MIKKVKEKLIVSKDTVIKEMAISTICKPISMIISYIYVPIVLHYLGVEKYGVWATILTILSWIGYFDIGIGNGLRNKLTESLSKKDGQSNKLISSAYMFITGIMVMIAIVFSAFAAFADWNRIFGVSDIHENLTVVVIISICFVALNFILSLCKNVLYALQKAADVSIMELATQMLNLVGILIVMRIFESNLFVMAFVYGMSMIVVNIIASIVIYRRNDVVCPKIKEIDVKVGKEITNLGMQFFVIQICALILFTTDSLIISYLYGASDVTPYNTVNKLFNIIIGIYSAMIAPVWSNVTKLMIENKYREICKFIKKLYSIWGIFVVMAVILTILFRPLSYLWLRQNLNYSNNLIIFGGMYCIINMWTNMNGTLANGLNILREQIIMAVIQAVLNIPISVFLAEYIGLGSAGVLLGTNFSLLISCITLPILIKYKVLKDE